MIVVGGESLMDLIVRPDGRVDAVPGGGPFNTARALAKLGCPTAFLGRLSTDRFGRILRDRLEAAGVDLSLASTTDDPTLLAVAELDDAGAAAYRFHAAGTAAAGLEPLLLPPRLPNTTTTFHVGTLGLVLEPMATTIEAYVAAAGPDVLVMADLNIRPAAIRDGAGYRQRLARLLGRADVVQASTDDLRWLESDRDPVDIARQLLASAPRAVLVTDGAGPVRVVTPGAVAEVAVSRVPITDTVGAGDAFGAGFIAAWTDGGRGRADLTDATAVVDAARFGVEVGALTVQRAGADPPTRAEVLAAGPGW